VFQIFSVRFWRKKIEGRRGTLIDTNCFSSWRQKIGVLAGNAGSALANRFFCPQFFCHNISFFLFTRADPRQPPLIHLVPACARIQDSATDGTRIKHRFSRSSACPRFISVSSVAHFPAYSLKIDLRAIIRSCNWLRPVGCKTFSRHLGGRKLSCVHSSTAANSCISFSRPCADGMNSA